MNFEGRLKRTPLVCPNRVCARARLLRASSSVTIFDGSSPPFFCGQEWAATRSECNAENTTIKKTLANSRDRTPLQMPDASCRFLFSVARFLGFRWPAIPRQPGAGRSSSLGGRLHVLQRPPMIPSAWVAFVEHPRLHDCRCAPSGARSQDNDQRSE